MHPAVWCSETEPKAVAVCKSLRLVVHPEIWCTDTESVARTFGYLPCAPSSVWCSKDEHHRDVKISETWRVRVLDHCRRKAACASVRSLCTYYAKEVLIQISYL